MEKPTRIRIEIVYLEKGREGFPQTLEYNEDELESAITTLQLWNGDICLEDLEP